MRTLSLIRPGVNLALSTTTRPRHPAPGNTTKRACLRLGRDSGSSSGLWHGKRSAVLQNVPGRARHARAGGRPAAFCAPC